MIELLDQLALLCLKQFADRGIWIVEIGLEVGNSFAKLLIALPSVSQRGEVSK